MQVPDLEHVFIRFHSCSFVANTPFPAFFPLCPHGSESPHQRCYTGQVVIAILLTLVHVVVCLFLIIVILLQSGKAADLAGAFGGMGSQTAFGPRGSATLLSKATTVSAILFMVISFSLSIIATKNQGSGTGTALQRHQTRTSAPVTPGPQQAAPKTTPVPVPAPAAPKK
jgi:preprotein translocase subunit SecG